MSNVVFITVKDSKEKLGQLCLKAELCLKTREKLLILVPDQAAYTFIDELLWRLPPASFLPHPSTYLQLSTQLQEADFVFNLRPSALLEASGIKKIFEFEDHTSKEKLELSKLRYTTYRDALFSISSQ